MEGEIPLNTERSLKNKFTSRQQRALCESGVGHFNGHKNASVQVT